MARTKTTMRGAYTQQPRRYRPKPPRTGKGRLGTIPFESFPTQMLPVTGSLARASRYFAGVARDRGNTQAGRVARREAAGTVQANCLCPGASLERLLSAYEWALQTPGGGPLERRLALILRPLALDGSTVGSTVGAKLILVDRPRQPHDGFLLCAAAAAHGTCTAIRQQQQQ
jgi:hypothetical protein